MVGKASGTGSRCFMKSTLALLDRRLGRCPRCMRMAFHAAFAGWGLVPISFLLNAGQLTRVAALLAVGLTALWIAHLVAFASRRETVGAHETADLPTRRAAIMGFSRAFALILLATALPGRGRAQSVCGCRVGDVCCNKQTRVTYECQTTSNGCTQWILKGAPCNREASC